MNEVAVQAVVLAQDGADDLCHRACAGLSLDPMPDLSGDGLEEVCRPVTNDHIQFSGQYIADSEIAYPLDLPPAQLHEPVPRCVLAAEPCHFR